MTLNEKELPTIPSVSVERNIGQRKVWKTFNGQSIIELPEHSFTGNSSYYYMFST